MFADGTNIFVFGENIDDVHEKANQILNCIHKYMLANQLHINLSKSCYMHFQPKKLEGLGLDILFSENGLEIVGVPIKAVRSNRFLGVIIDEDLTWLPHIHFLTQKVNCQVGALNRIKGFVPRKFHKDLYHTLFESHITYCVSVWGGVSSCKLEPLFIAQKSCVRTIFDNERYSNKRSTCARCRPIGKQFLDSSFYQKKHTKPLLQQNEILSIHNLYIYHCFIELFKILKFRQPYSLFESIAINKSYNRSTRHNSTYIDIPKHFSAKSSIFAYKAAKIWNNYRVKLEIFDYEISVSIVKSRLKSLIMCIQNSGDPTEWNSQNICDHSPTT